MRRKHLKIVAEVLFILSVILWVSAIMYPRLDFPLYEPDEAAWIYSGYYFNLFFLKLNLSHRDWTDYDASDHPPLVKYIVGGTLFLKGHTFDSLDAKTVWHSIPMNKYAHYKELLLGKIPKQILPAIRFVIFIFALLSVFLLYIFVRTSYGILPAIFSTSLLITNSIFVEVSTQVTADPVLLFFFIFFVLLCALFLKSGNPIHIYFGFVLSSLAFLTKLNGLVLVFVLFLIVIIKNRFPLKNYDFKVLGLGFVAFLVMTTLLNPFFLHSGIYGLVKMFEQRMTHIHLQQEIFHRAALLSVGERFKAETALIFFGSSVIYKLTKIPLELITFLLGVYYSIRKKDFILLTILVFFVFLPLSLLPLTWKRYYYIVLPFIYILAGASLNIFKELNKRAKT